MSHFCDHRKRSGILTTQVERLNLSGQSMHLPVARISNIQPLLINSGGLVVTYPKNQGEHAYEMHTFSMVQKLMGIKCIGISISNRDVRATRLSQIL